VLAGAAAGAGAAKELYKRALKPEKEPGTLQGSLYMRPNQSKEPHDRAWKHLAI